MKKLIILISLFIGIIIVNPLQSKSQCCSDKEKYEVSKTGPSANQNNNLKGVYTDSLKVSGLCDMCKTRIENAAKGVKGVTTALWNESTNMLVYSYTGTVKKEDVSNALLKVGHDTELGKAPDNVYNKLPGCCKYR